MNQFGQIKERYWKSYPILKVFEEGYNKDYVYEERKNIPILGTNSTDVKNSINVEHELNLTKKTGFVGGKSQTLLTMRGAIKFNMWKRTEDNVTD